VAHLEALARAARVDRPSPEKVHPHLARAARALTEEMATVMTQRMITLALMASQAKAPAASPERAHPHLARAARTHLLEATTHLLEATTATMATREGT
jgi:hypothetical protein